MHIVLISQTACPPALQGALQPHRLTPLQGTLGQWQAQVRSMRPEVLLLRDFEQSAGLIAQIDALCTALPQLALVPLCLDPAPAFLMGAMRAGVREVLPNDEAATLTGLLARLQQRQSGREALPAAGRCIGFLPAKGGDGASSTAANLAMAVAALPGQRVLLMDLSLPFGDLELFLGSEPLAHDLGEVCAEIERIDGALLDGLSQHLLPRLHLIGSPPSLESYLQLRAEQVLRLIRVAQQHYEFVFLDLGLDAIALAALETLDQLVVLACPSLPSVKGCGHLLALWEQLGHASDQLKLALRAGPPMAIRAADVASALGRPVDRPVPEAGELLATALAQGRAAVQLQPRSEFARFMAAWAAELTGQAPAAPTEKSLWQRLRIR